VNIDHTWYFSQTSDHLYFDWRLNEFGGIYGGTHVAYSSVSSNATGEQFTTGTGIVIDRDHSAYLSPPFVNVRVPSPKEWTQAYQTGNATISVTAIQTFEQDRAIPQLTKYVNILPSISYGGTVVSDIHPVMPNLLV